ncbi:MAG: EF-P lysine aminoacylase GenX [Magnetococcales bacterium]|nr:EF-P lysine aminoacylase GenX [Magnetococcales bacterium]
MAVAPGDGAEERSWRPVATRETLAERARIIAEVRRFFAERGVLEVETPLLSRGMVPERHLEPIPCAGGYLHTSPEAAMKRLVAAGYGAIFQLCRVFRADEAGPWHNPEFTMLEWYRPGWTLARLLAEVEELVRCFVVRPPARVLPWRDLFRHHLHLDPLTATREELVSRTASPTAGLDADGLLDLLWVELVEPALVQDKGMLLVSDFPASRAAMAQVHPGPPPVALRGELYVDGVELANGYQELTDPREQAERLERANQMRHAAGLPRLPVDARFLAALAHGLPECAGVALGVDRLVMLALGRESIQDVLAFPCTRA